jgi:hypothetical protein
VTSTVGLTAGLPNTLASRRLMVHDRGRMLADLACAVADGAEVTGLRGWRARPAYLDAAHRVHARVEDCVRTGRLRVSRAHCAATTAPSVERQLTQGGLLQASVFSPARADADTVVRAAEKGDTVRQTQHLESSAGPHPAPRNLAELVHRT